MYEHLLRHLRLRENGEEVKEMKGLNLQEVKKVKEVKVGLLLKW